MLSIITVLPGEYSHVQIVCCENTYTKHRRSGGWSTAHAHASLLKLAHCCYLPVLREHGRKLAWGFTKWGFSGLRSEVCRCVWKCGYPSVWTAWSPSCDRQTDGQAACSVAERDRTCDGRTDRRTDRRLVAWLSATETVEKTWSLQNCF